MDEIYPIPGFREPFSSFTHLLAAGVFAFLGVYLVRRGRGSWNRTISLAVLSVSSVFLLAASGIYHLLDPGPLKAIARQFDIAGVFALIAGTVTPLHAILFNGFQRWGPLALVWTTAIVGITLRSLYPYGMPPGFGTVLFLLMGWGGFISCILLWRRYGFNFVRPLLWGGIAYSVGAVLLLFNRPILVPHIICAHEVWHLAVITGLGFHWHFIFQFAAGPPNETASGQGNGKRAAR